MEEEFSLNDLTVLELQQECKKRGLKKNGSKAKLMQRLAEYIDKYGRDHIEPFEKSSQVVESPVEKSVMAIHDPHPYMEEYEEQLIESVTNDDRSEAGVDNFFRPNRNAISDSVEEKVDHSNDNESQQEGENGSSVTEYIDDNAEESEMPDSPTYPATGNSFAEAKDTDDDPMTGSPTYPASPVERVIQLPDNVDSIEQESLPLPEDKEINDTEGRNNNSFETDVAVQNLSDEDQDGNIDDELGVSNGISDVQSFSEEERAHNSGSEIAECDNGNSNGQSFSDEEQVDNIETDVKEALHIEENTTEKERGDEFEEQEDGKPDEADQEPEFYGEGNEEVNDEEEIQGRKHGFDDALSEGLGEAIENEGIFHDEQSSTFHDEEFSENVETETEKDMPLERENDERENGNDEREDENDEIMYDPDEKDMMNELDVALGCDEGGEELEEGEITVGADDNDDQLDISVQGDRIEEHEIPFKPVKKVVPPIPLKKRISLLSPENSDELTKRKRRWGSTLTSSMDSNFPISTESIKKLIPDLKIDNSVIDNMSELDYQEDDFMDGEIIDDLEEVEVLPEEGSPPKIFKGGRSVKVQSEKKITIEKPSNTVQDVVSIESDTGEIATPTSPIVVTKTSVQPNIIEDEIEVEEQREKSPSPALNPSSQYIHIENLVRPYTISQLKAVISRTGHICDGGFWINNIKSQCYVKLSTELEAAATREALHGLRWPAGSPKLLKIDFAINEHMYKETTGLLGEKAKIVIEIEDKDADSVIETEEEVIHAPRTEEANDPTERNESKKRSLPKEHQKLKKKEKKDTQQREEGFVKLLDDLFLKTKATPCIYWLPLTEEQILKKESKSQRK